MSSDNPYASSHVDPTVIPDGPMGLQPGTPRGMVNQVHVVGILMMVQGGFELFFGISMTVLAIFVPVILQSEFQNQPAGGPSPQQLQYMVLGIYGGMGAVHLITGGLRFYAGFRIYKFRNRVLGLIALGVGALDLFGCYCLPTSIALAIYGCVVLLNSSVILAFRFGKHGHSGSEIITAFNRLGS